MSSIEEKVIDKIRGRAERGWKKYGTTMERDDLSFLEWIVHLQEELMDATIYIQKIINDAPLFEQQRVDPYYSLCESLERKVTNLTTENKRLTDICHKRQKIIDSCGTESNTLNTKKESE